MAGARILDALPPLLAQRLRRLAAQWSLDDAEALVRVLERGLYECEAELRARFSASDLDAWRAAIRALEAQPDDAGFASTGRGAGARRAGGDEDGHGDAPPEQA